MGQKVHPLGFRVGITKKHQSQWFAYLYLLLGDLYVHPLFPFPLPLPFSLPCPREALSASLLPRDASRCSEPPCPSARLTWSRDK